jgi:hypothetical protein
MPFQPRFDPVFAVIRQAATHAVPGERIDCHWLKDVQAAGRITDDILAALHRCALCIADVTGHNPNVMWETGYAMALGKPTILIATDVESLPFDLKVHRVLPYRLGSLDALAGLVVEAIRQTMARYAIKPNPVSKRAWSELSPVIGVTGTMVADAARVRRRLEVVLGPYLPLGATWYCGTYGMVNQTALAYLLEHHQRVVVVGSHPYDLWVGGRELVEKGEVQFLDASLESFPKGLAGPSPRDVLFATKADLVAVFWDGKSPGTEQTIRYYQQHGKTLLWGLI